MIPIFTGWDFATFRYLDFWTPQGFLRNTFYNGWNSIFPWFSYFLVGMWLGRLDWTSSVIRRNIFILGLVVFMLIQLLRLAAGQGNFNPFWTNYIMAEYFPPYLPFVLVTTGFAFMAISALMYVGERTATSPLTWAFQKTGQMTLTHYVLHLTLGMIILARLTGKNYTGYLEDEQPTSAVYILIYSIAFYILSMLFSVMWSKWFKTGPMELIMRKFSG